MNKKFTSRRIAIIVLQCLMIILTVTVVGGAVMAHDEFKATATKPDTSQTESVSENVGEDKTSPTTVPPVAVSDYKYSYAGFSPKVITPSINLASILLNTEYILPDGYTPTLAELSDGTGIMADYRVVPYFRAMCDAAKRDGITLVPISGYVSISEQENEFDSYVSNAVDKGKDKKSVAQEAAKTILLPGADEHNAGLAVDICSKAESFEDTDEFAWLSEHCADYGFILRYPKDEDTVALTGVEYKPWHYRYVGVDAAKDIKQKGITLEEYLR